MAFGEQGAEGQRLRSRPVDAFAGLDRLAAIVEEALDGAVDVKILRDGGDLLADLAQGLERDAGMAAARVFGVAGLFQAGPAAVEPVGLVCLVAVAGLVLGF
jgi:hypothetical protein